LWIPCIGFGTYKLLAAEAEPALDAALESGYRHFDCAYLYQNEELIGQRLQKWFAEDILWNTFHRPDLVRVGCKRSLDHLQLDYFDLYLVHWPAFDYTDLLETWRAMENLVSEGLCRAIGVSNFNRRQLKRILDNCTIKPAMLQVESHTHFPNTELIDFARSNGMLVTAYSPLGIVCKIAEKYKKTPGQVLLRHGIQRGIVVIPKSKTPSRIAENINVRVCVIRYIK
uniref:Aldo_ket_red domain-containing protein n=1 Tax=Schistocephalus solidus TaxID=70667 RepID=A0A183T5H6_SCHSO